MKQWTIAVLAALLLFSGVSYAAGYEITKVIEVGPAAWAPFSGPLKWSPDGTKLAYVSGGKLMLSDTLGNSHEIAPLDWHPHRVNWIDDHNLAIKLKRRFGRDSTLNRMSMFEIDTGKETVLATYRRTMESQWVAGNQAFDGPFLTLEGTAYYDLTTYDDGTKASTIEHPWITSGGDKDLSDHRRLAILPDGIYTITLGRGDSTRLMSNLYPDTRGPFSVSNDGQFFVNGGRVFKTKDGTELVMDTLSALVPPPGTIGCGFLFVNMNPMHPEVLFHMVCEDDKNYVIDQIGTFDLNNYEFVILDSLLGLKNCRTPVFSSEGDKIAFLSDGQAYIIYRGRK